MGGIQKVKCDNCGFEQNRIFVYGMGGAGLRRKYACLKCKKVITLEGEREKCPKCDSKLVKLYEENSKDDYHTCPNCGQRKLKFYHEGWT